MTVTDCCWGNGLRSGAAILYMDNIDITIGLQVSVGEVGYCIWGVLDTMMSYSIELVAEA